MSKLLLLNLLMGAGLAYAAVREHRQDARTFRVLATVSSLSLLASLALMLLARGST